jgi:hypothetical protein
MENRVVTCVYCGHQYPSGTPTSQNDQLTAHIKVCEKHPMREAEKKIAVLKNALQMLVGCDKKNELEQMKIVICSLGAPVKDTAAMVNAIQVLIDYSE